MGEPIRILAIDDNVDRIQQLIRSLSEYDPDIKIDHPSGILALIQLIESNTYDCIITPDEISILNNIELNQKISEVLSIPILRYLEKSRLPTSTTEHTELQENLHYEDALYYSTFATRIRKTLNMGNRRGRAINLDLPETPKVTIRGNKIYIVKENGFEELWGNESTETIEDVAILMELELKTIQWVRLELERFIGELTESIKCSDIPPYDVSDIIYEGYRSLLSQFQRIDKSKNHR